MPVPVTEPVDVWTEPCGASAWRVGGRAALGAWWLFLALVLPWVLLKGLFAMFAGLAFAHAALAVANLWRNGGVVLRLMPSGDLQWPRSYQEAWLRRTPDRVDGPRIEVILEPDHPGISRAEPRVTLRGPSAQIAHLPLHGVRLETFIERANVVVEPHGIVFVRSGLLDPMADADGTDDAAATVED